MGFSSQSVFSGVKSWFLFPSNCQHQARALPAHPCKFQIVAWRRHLGRKRSYPQGAQHDPADTMRDPQMTANSKGKNCCKTSGPSVYVQQLQLAGNKKNQKDYRYILFHLCKSFSDYKQKIKQVMFLNGKPEIISYFQKGSQNVRVDKWTSENVSHPSFQPRN